jgi:hypothetical protein
MGSARIGLRAPCSPWSGSPRTPPLAATDRPPLPAPTELSTRRVSLAEVARQLHDVRRFTEAV